MTSLFLIPPVSGSQLTPPVASFRTIEGLAAWYVRCIRAQQPTGPYRLAGGPATYEIATQLIGENEHVEYLALFDAESLEGADPIPTPIHLFVTSRPRTSFPSAQIQTHIVPDMQAALAEAVAHSLQLSTQQAGPPRTNSAALLTLQAGHREIAPIFCVPGAGDSITAFASLGEALGSHFTLHGFQPQGLIGQEPPHNSVEAAASCYIQALLREHPQGAYHLLGHSFGGWIVFEIAAQMRALGRNPTSIVVIDTEGPGQAPREYTQVEALLELASMFELQAERPLNLKPSSFETLSKDARLRLLHKQLTLANLLPPWSTVQDLTAVFRVFAANIRTAYQPRFLCEQPVDLLWVPVDAEPTPASAPLWREWAPNLHLHRVAGNHATLLEPPHVAELARALQSVMSRSNAP